MSEAMIRAITDRLKSMRVRESSEALTYKDYLEISGAKDSRESYIKFLVQTKDVDKQEAEKQAGYNYDEGRKIVEETEEEAERRLEFERDAQYTPEKPRADRRELMESLSDVVYDVLSSFGLPTKIEIKGGKLYYTIEGYRCYSEVVRSNVGLYSLPGFTVYDPEVEYRADQDDIPESVDKVLDAVYTAVESAVRSYNESYRRDLEEYEDGII